MENNEIMVTEEIVERSTGSGFKKALAVGGVIAGVALVGFGLYKGVKAVREKLQARRELEEQIDDATED